MNEGRLNGRPFAMLMACFSPIALDSSFSEWLDDGQDNDCDQNESGKLV